MVRITSAQRATTTGSGDTPSSRRNASSAEQSTVRNVVTCGIGRLPLSFPAISRRTASTG